MNVTGVAAATVISTALSAGAVLFLLVRESTYLRPEFSCQDKENVREIVRIGLPAALQGAVFCFANIFIQAAVNSFGADAAAGSAVAMTFEYFAYYAIISRSSDDHIYKPELFRTQLFPLQKSSCCLHPYVIHRLRCPYRPSNISAKSAKHSSHIQ